MPAPYDVPDSPLLADGNHFGELGGVRIHLEDRPNGTIHVYITKGNFDPALLPEARERFDRVYRRRPGQKVITYNAQFSWKQLEEWAPQVAKAGIDRKTLGITKWTLNEQTRLITVHAVAKRNNRQRIQDFIASTAVPRHAVSLEIGCDYISSMLTQEFLLEGFDQTLAYWVEAQPQAQYGETVDLKLTIDNRTSEMVPLYGPGDVSDFVISDENGKMVWQWNCSKMIRTPDYSREVSPDEPLQFTGRWEQIDMKGAPVPPGTYTLIGTLGLVFPERLVTGPVTIEVLPP